MGIEGTFDKATYLNLFAGYTTDENGERDKRLPKYMHPERRGAFEITVNLPKSASVAKELGEDSRIDAVMTKARNAVAMEVQKQARVKVTKKSEIEKSKHKMPKGWKYPERKSENLIWVAHRHANSRSNDLHSHDHLIFFNLSFDKQEKTWKAIELRYVDKPKLSKIYRETMIKGLNELGYKTERVGNEYEVVGVPAEVKAEFSRRHHAIKDIEADFETKKGSPLTSKAKSKLSVIDRPDKPLDVPLVERKRAWQDRISPVQLSGLKGLVSRARSVVRLSKLRQGLQKQLSHIRQSVIHHEEPSHEQGRGFER